MSDYNYKDIRTEMEEEEKMIDSVSGLKESVIKEAELQKEEISIHELDEIGPGYQEDPLEIQIGGDYYKGFNIQPIEFITRNKLGFIQGCVIKRICRYNLKGGKGGEDLLKIKHEVDILLNLEEL